MCRLRMIFPWLWPIRELKQHFMDTLRKIRDQSLEVLLLSVERVRRLAGLHLLQALPETHERIFLWLRGTLKNKSVFKACLDACIGKHLLLDIGECLLFMARQKFYIGYFCIHDVRPFLIQYSHQISLCFCPKSKMRLYTILAILMDGWYQYSILIWSISGENVCPVPSLLRLCL